MLTALVWLITVSCTLLYSQLAAAAYGPGPITTYVAQQGSPFVQGIPVCPPGLSPCELHGCYSPLLHKCAPGHGCQPVGVLAQLSSLVRHGFNAAASSNTGGARGGCLIPFANTCGNSVFCSSNEVCSGRKCVPGGAGRLEFSTPSAAAGSASAQAACTAARESIAACAADASQLVVVDCESIGIAPIRGIKCLQSESFNCAVAPGVPGHYACRGLAAVTQAVTDVVNTTLNTAAALSAAAQSVMTQEQQMKQEQEVQAMTAATVLDGPDFSSKHTEEGSSSSSSSSTTSGGTASGWKHELETLGQAVKQHSQPLLQPFFQNLADKVSDASKSVFNMTLPGFKAELGQGSNTAGVQGSPHRLSVLDLGPAPIRNAAGDRVSMATGALLAMTMTLFML